jgi:hypothetical protein
MSGGGGGGSYDWRPGGDGLGGASASDPCEIVEETILNSPNREILRTLETGEVLTISYVSGPPPQLLVLQADTTAGSITSPSMLAIIRCIESEGRMYQATVLSVLGAVCKVRIEPR